LDFLSKRTHAVLDGSSAQAESVALNGRPTSATDQLSPAGITRTFAPPPNSACDFISFFAWHRGSSELRPE
jgi:hypothetical protein